MMKKYSKILIAALVCFSVSTVNVSAKNYTNPENSVSEDFINDVTEKFNSLHPGKHLSFIYVIGDHAITSSHTITTAEFMEASDSIDSKNTGRPYTFYFINNQGATIDEDKWVVEGTQFPETMTIKHVDFTEDLYATEFNAEKYISNLETTLNNETNTFYTVKYENGELKVVLKDNTQNVAGTGIFTAITEILKDNACASITLTYKNAAKESKSVVITAEDLEDNSKFNEVIAGLLNIQENGGLTDKVLNDLHGKSFDITFQMANEEETKYIGKESYKVEFYSEIDTDAFLKKYVGYSVTNSTDSSYVFSCHDSEDKHCVPVINILKPTNTFSGLAKLESALKAALDDSRIEKVQINIGKANVEYTNNTEVDLTSLVRSALGSKTDENKKYSDLAALKTATVTFTFDTGVESIYKEDTTTATYTINIGEYVDTDEIVDQIAASNNGSKFTSASKVNEFYNLSRDKNKLTLNVNLQSNGQLYSFQTVTNGLQGIIYNSSNGYAVLKDGTQISKISIIDNKTSQEYELKTSGNTGLTLTKILAKILGVDSANGSVVSPTMLKNLDISIKFEIASGKKLIPGVVGGVYVKNSDENSKETATYDISFKINGFDFKDMIKSGFKNDTYLDLTETNTDKVYTLTVDLKNVGTSLEKANLFNKLGWYAGLFKSMVITVDGTDKELNLANLEEVKTTIDNLLGLSDSSTIEDLLDKEFTLKLELADDVNLLTGKEFTTNDNRDTDVYTLNVKLGYDVETVGEHDSIATALEKTPEVIDLTEKAVYGADLTIGNNNSTNDNVVINGHGATINGDVTVKANNVTFNDVNITGKLVVNSSDTTVKDITIIGDGNTTLTGAVDIQNNANVTIEGMKIIGTNEKIGVASTHNTNKTNAVINVAKGTGTFTLKNSEVSYNGGTIIPTGGSNTDTYVYSLVYIDGNAEIIGNKFDITNVKNPIEYKYGATDASDIVIKNNTFTGKNYVNGDAHNVISFYGAKDNSVIEVSNNEFAYANWAIRISNTTPSNKVTYIITDNKVKENTIQDSTDRNPLALVGVQAVGSGDDLSNITIVYNDNTAKGYVDYETAKLPYHTNASVEEGKSALVYAYKSGNTDISTNLPHMTTYADYNAQQDTVE